MILLKKTILSLLIVGTCFQFNFITAAEWSFNVPIDNSLAIETATPWISNISEVVRDNPQMAALPVLFAVLVVGRNKVYQFSKKACDVTAQKIAKKEEETKSRLPVPVQMAYQLCRDTAVKAVCPFVTKFSDYVYYNWPYWCGSALVLASGQVILFLPGKLLATLIAAYGHMNMGSSILQKKIDDLDAKQTGLHKDTQGMIGQLRANNEVLHSQTKKTVEAQADQTRKKIDQAKQEVINAVNKDITELSSQMNDMQEKINSLGVDINGKVDGVGQKVDALAQEIGNISQQIVKSVETIETVERNNVERDQSVQNALVQLVQATSNFVDLKKNFDEVLGKHVEINTAVQSVKSTQEVQDGKIDQLLHDASEKARLLIVLQGSLEAVQKNEANILNQLSGMIENTSRTKNELNVLKKLQKSCNGSIVGLTENISLIESGVKTIQASYSSLFERMDKVEESIATIATQVTGVHGKFDIVLEQNKTLCEENKALKLQNDGLEKRMAAMEEGLKILGINFNNLNRDMRSVGAQISKDSSAARQDASVTRQEISHLSAQLHNFAGQPNLLTLEPSSNQAIITIPVDPQIPSDFGKGINRRPQFGRSQFTSL